MYNCGSIASLICNVYRLIVALPYDYHMLLYGPLLTNPQIKHTKTSIIRTKNLVLTAGLRVC